MCNCCGLCSEKVRAYAFWSLIALLTALTVHDVWLLFGEYIENPKLADMGFVFNDTMKLPVFTVCIPTPMVLSIFNSTLFNTPDDKKTSHNELEQMQTADVFLKRDWDWRLVEDAYRTIAKIHSIERETDDSYVGNEIKKLQKQNSKTKQLKKIQQWQKHLAERKVEFVDFVQKTGNEVLKRMVKKAIRSSMDNEDYFNATYKVTWISEPNICFQPQFSGNGSQLVTTQGQFFHMKIGHDPRKVDSQQHLIIDLNGRDANMAEFRDSGGHTTEGVNNGIKAGTISDLLVEIRTVYELLENEEEGTACVSIDDDEDEDESPNQTEFTPVFECQGRCRADLIRELCHCTPISTYHLVKEYKDMDIYPVCDYATCNIGNNSKTMNEKRCVAKCRHGCTMTRYSIKQLNNRPSIGLREGHPMLFPNQTTFLLQWGAFEFLHMEQSYKYESFVSFVSELGGTLGIWLGLSVLTLLQGSVFVTEKLTEKVKDRRKKSHMPAGERKLGDEDRKSSFSQNPFGDGNLSENPFGDFSSGTGHKNELQAVKSSNNQSTHA
ncbi:Del-6 [Aphelenchoides besseyi]|nr:Del-6 [Aphelenchoides besseyi]